MKLTLKLIASLLTLCLLLCAVCACRSTDDLPDDTSPDAPSALPTDDPFVDDLPELNYENATVSILCSAKDTVADEFYVDNTVSNNISTAVFKRNEMVKSRLGVSLNIIYDRDSASRITTLNEKHEIAVASNDTSYDIVSGATFATTAFVNKGLYRNLYNCQYIDLDKYYWSQGFNDAFSYGTDKQYIATGSAAISIYRFLYSTIFNKEMLNAKHETSLYDVVENGDWTLEYQLNLSKRLAVYSANSEPYIYGAALGLLAGIDSYWVSSDAIIVSKDAQNQFKYNMATSTNANKFSLTVDKLLALYRDSSTFVVDHDDDGFTGRSKTIEKFYNRQAAMTTAIFYNIESSTDKLVDIDYGVIPMPKYDKGQTEYHCGIQDQVSALGISLTVSDSRLQMVGAVLECMASESYKTVVDEYYGEIMNYRLLQDAESQKMLDMIYTGARIDLALMYTNVLGEGMGGLTVFLRDIVNKGYSSGSNAVSSRLSAINKTLKSNVRELNERFDQLEAKYLH